MVEGQYAATRRGMKQNERRGELQEEKSSVELSFPTRPVDGTIKDTYVPNVYYILS